MPNPFPPGNFAENRAAFWSKKRKFTAKPIDGNAHSPNFVARGRHDGRDPLVQRNSWRILGMRRKQNFEIVFGFKSNTAVLTFSFRFLSTRLPSISLSFFFLFLDFVSEGKVFEIPFLSRNLISTILFVFRLWSSRQKISILERGAFA